MRALYMSDNSNNNHKVDNELCVKCTQLKALIN